MKQLELFRSLKPMFRIHSHKDKFIETIRVISHASSYPAFKTRIYYDVFIEFDIKGIPRLIIFSYGHDAQYEIVFDLFNFNRIAKGHDPNKIFTRSGKILAKLVPLYIIKLNNGEIIPMEIEE